MPLNTTVGARPAFTESSFPRWPIWREDEREALLAALDSGAWAGSRATSLPRFAGAFAKFQGAERGVPLANGTVTLEAALVACDIGEGDEVIVPALTFVATATAVVRVNAIPVFVDIDPDTMCLDPALAAAAITPRTRAIIAVHLGGAVCDLDALARLCERSHLRLIEDCAHAHGSRWRGRGVGSFGSMGSFSFQHSKLLTAGEGGALITNDDALAEAAWNYANCGRATSGGPYDHPIIGTNSRMTEWQAAILEGQLRRYPEQFAVRERNAAVLTRAFAEIPGLKAQHRDERADANAYYSLIIRCDQEVLSRMSRDAIHGGLVAAGVPMMLGYPPMNDLEVFRRGAFGPTRRGASATVCRDGSTPVARATSASTLWLHHRALLADPPTVARIAEVCADILRPVTR